MTQYIKNFQIKLIKHITWNNNDKNNKLDNSKKIYMKEEIGEKRYSEKN